MTPDFTTHRGFSKLIIQCIVFSLMQRMSFRKAPPEEIAGCLSLIALTAVLLLSPDLAPAQTNIPAPLKVCRACHERIPARLAFVSLGTRGGGVKGVSTLYKAEDNTSSGRVRASRLLFRDEQGMKMVSEIGKYPPRGSLVVFGNKAYRMWKNGLEWNMRNVVSINGLLTGGNVFIAERFVEKLPADKTNYHLKSIVYSNATLQATAPEHTREYLQNLIDKYLRTDTKQKAVKRKKQKKGPVEQDNPGLASDKPAGPEKSIQAAAPTEIIIREEGGAYKVRSYSGGLTIEHTFKGKSNITLHEARPKAYPHISYQEVFSIPLAKVKENILDYIRGFDGNFENNILALMHEELRPMFNGSAARRLPDPDNRIVTGLRLGEDNDTKQLLFNLSSGQWIPVTDESLVKIIRSEIIPPVAGESGNK